MTSVDPTTILGAVLDALVEPILITDAEGRLTFANASAAHALGAAGDVGRAVDELLDRHPARTPDGAPVAAALHPIRRALAQGQAVIGAELTLELEGRPATFLVNSVPLRDETGRLTGTVSMFHDVTGASSSARSRSMPRGCERSSIWCTRRSSSSPPTARCCSPTTLPASFSEPRLRMSGHAIGSAA
jgi:nitrogen-specific signal transduction histidine kinase